MYCPKCGAEINDQSRFCSKCGSSITARSITTRVESPSSVPDYTSVEDLWKMSNRGDVEALRELRDRYATGKKGVVQNIEMAKALNPDPSVDVDDIVPKQRPSAESKSNGHSSASDSIRTSGSNGSVNSSTTLGSISLILGIISFCIVFSSGIAGFIFATMADILGARSKSAVGRVGSGIATVTIIICVIQLIGYFAIGGAIMSCLGII